MTNTFDNFKPVKGSEKALTLFKELSTLPSWFMLLCYGGVGSGKTHLCNALASVLKLKGIFCRVTDWGEMYTYLSNLKRLQFKEGDRYFEVSSRFEKTEYLILDDFDISTGGTGYKAQEEMSYFEGLIKYRYKNRLFTVVTTNLDTRIDDRNPSRPFIPPRIVSRFSDGETSRKVLNKAGDYRPLKGK